MNFSRFFKRCSLDDFHKYKMSMGLYNGRNRCSTLRLSWPTYGRRGIRAQKNSKSFCGIFNSDRNQIKSRSLYKREPPSLETRFYWNCEYHNGTKADFENASKSSSLKVSHLYECLRIRIRSVLHTTMSIPCIAFCNLISLWICLIHYIAFSAAKAM